MFDDDVDVCGLCSFFDDDMRICKLSGRNLDFLNLACSDYDRRVDFYDLEVSE